MYTYNFEEGKEIPWKSFFGHLAGRNNFGNTNLPKTEKKKIKCQKRRENKPASLLKEFLNIWF